MKYDAIIIGSGFAGAVVAQRLADNGKKVLIIEQREHIGGNCYDTIDEHGVLVHKYGPHIFHTNNKEVYDYLSRFTEWYRYSHEVEAKINGQFVPVPFNINTLHLVYDQKLADDLERKLVTLYGEGKKVPILELMNSDDKDIKGIADYVYNNIFLKYTMKQWGQKPEDIDPSVTARVPVSISKDNRYFTDTYQGMPLNGYTPIFQKMLNNPNIKVVLGKNAKDLLTFTDDEILYENESFDGELVYTGAIDELFDCEYGRLPYRTLEFVFEYHDEDSYQPKAVVNYTVDEDFTRITEFKKLTGQIINGTTIIKEYSDSYTGKDGQIPYYAIINQENMRMYTKYLEKTSAYKNFHLLGRLAEYKYYNIDAIVEKALRLSEKLCDGGQE